MSSVKHVIIDYTNWKGERRERRIQPWYVWWGESEYHDGGQWFLRARDLDKEDAVRDFALASVHGWKNA